MRFPVMEEIVRIQLLSTYNCLLAIANENYMLTGNCRRLAICKSEKTQIESTFENGG